MIYGLAAFVLVTPDFHAAYRNNDAGIITRMVITKIFANYSNVEFNVDTLLILCVLCTSPKAIATL